MCCYGIPLNGWSNNSFKAIGELWGTFISTDEATLRLTSFAVAKVLVATSEFKEIDEWINIDIEGKSYRIKVMEEYSCDQLSEAEKQMPLAHLELSKPQEEEDDDGDGDDELDNFMANSDTGNERSGEDGKSREEKTKSPVMVDKDVSRVVDSVGLDTDHVDGPGMNEAINTLAHQVDPEIVGQDTKLENADVRMVQRLWGNTNVEFAASNSIGASGGILILWDFEVFKASNITVHRSFIILEDVNAWHDGHCSQPWTFGLNDDVVAGLAVKSGEWFAYDSYRRFLDMFGDVVMGIRHSSFEEKLEHVKNVRGVKNDTELTASDLKALVGQYKNVYLETKGENFPSDPKKQLQLALKAVFDSWDSPRAIKYRSINHKTGLKGTAVNIQCTVFGNMGNTSGTGVLFTRNPSTGEKKLHGEFLAKRSVAGIRTPENLDAMKSYMPEAYKELVENCEILEGHYKDMMDIEFTVQESKLWMLQCRTGKRTGACAVKIAVDMVNEGLVDTRTAIKMVERQHLDQLLHPQVRTETSPEDVGGMHAAAGISTARGGMTSHAAVVARGWGKCCIAGCAGIRVNDSDKVVVIGDKVIGEGEWISLNGSTGEVIMGKQPLSPPALSGDLETFMSWADKLRQLKVMANADTPEDALTARNNGAEGIGLCRTEHMFFASDERIKAVRKMIMAVTSEQRKEALDVLLPFQRSDFEGIFCAMDGLPVTIRLLDPPLHEFLPEGDLQDIVSELTKETGVTEDEVYSRIVNLSEVNPMLGFRGCRLGISYPELTEMQELQHQASIIHSVAKKVFAEMGSSLSYCIGTMIEVPRAALIADEIFTREPSNKKIILFDQVLDQKGVGQLVKIATEKGCGARPSLKASFFVLILLSR
ncbi:hypothetical protein RHMOL_Rhmol02G0017000 [Rhododendron molle]|uniref:Uncharacterized protein n=1 Tax=Rhododendron molle TaxID=49168 RepID=A0ACC0PLW3_RHOML|nr:hypothetical protein RHMOL_Rhmol02G0017000 [Rhododendron molle]